MNSDDSWDSWRSAAGVQDGTGGVRAVEGALAGFGLALVLAATFVDVLTAAGAAADAAISRARFLGACFAVAALFTTGPRPRVTPRCSLPTGGTCEGIAAFVMVQFYTKAPLHGDGIAGVAAAWPTSSGPNRVNRWTPTPAEVLSPVAGSTQAAKS